jgi:hypothetical protein
MIYFIITTSLIDRDWEIRQNQNKLAIYSLLEFLKFSNVTRNDIQPIIVENQLATVMENPSSFLDNFGIPVLYTKNNTIPTQNKGIKEWADIQYCIEKFNIQENDFVVKMTGRYVVIHNESQIGLNGHENFSRDIGRLIHIYNACLPPLSGGIGNVLPKTPDFYNNDLRFYPSFLSFLIINMLNDNNSYHDCLIRYGSYNDPTCMVPIEDCITGLIGMRCKHIKNIPRPQEHECVEHLWAKASLNIPEERVKKFDKLGIYITPACNSYFLV